MLNLLTLTAVPAEPVSIMAINSMVDRKKQRLVDREDPHDTQTSCRVSFEFTAYLPSRIENRCSIMKLSL